MPPKPRKSVQNPSARETAIAAKGRKAAGPVKAQRIDNTGLTSRVRGHVSARGKRAQAKRDGR